jgi:hypothetical protein
LMASRVHRFLECIRPGSVANTVYEYTDETGNLNIGVLKTPEIGVTEFYYLMIMF